jgi:hypothetical protein
MTTTTFLLQNITELFSNYSLMKGGANNVNKTLIANTSNNQKNLLIYFIFIVFMLLLKGFIVYLSYNFVIPKILYSLSKNESFETIESNFKPISYSESLLLVILTNTLFSM